MEKFMTMKDRINISDQELGEQIALSKFCKFLNIKLNS